MARRTLLIALLAVLFVLIAFASANLPTADFYNLYGAARNALRGHSPYEGPGYLSAPWGVVPLFPFALMPPAVAHGLYFATCLYILVFVAWRLRASPLAIAAFMLSPTAIGALLVGNLDAVVISGVLFPPILGLLILMTKPQIGSGVALYYLIDYVRQKRWLEGLKAFAPLAGASALALVFFPVWYIRSISNPSNIWNRSLFPYSIPLALLLLWVAVRNRNPFFALASTAFLAPYLSFYTYLIVQIGLLHPDVERVIRRDVLHILLAIFLWVIMLVFRL